MRAQGPASRSASSRRADRHCSTRLPAPGPGRQLAEQRQHLRQDGRGVTDHGEVRGHVLVHLRRVDVDPDDRAHTGRPGGDHTAPQVGVPDLGPHEQQHVGGVDRGVGGGQAHRRAERRGVPLVQDALAVHGGQDGHAPVGQPADLGRSGSRSPAGDDQRALQPSEGPRPRPRGPPAAAGRRRAWGGHGPGGAATAPPGRRPAPRGARGGRADRRTPRRRPRPPRGSRPRSPRGCCGRTPHRAPPAGSSPRAASRRPHRPVPAGRPGRSPAWARSRRRTWPAR